MDYREASTLGSCVLLPASHTHLLKSDAYSVGKRAREYCWRSLILLAVSIRALMLSINSASAGGRWPETSIFRGNG